MNMDRDEIEGRLAALEYLAGQLLRQIPYEERQKLLAETQARFTGHAHKPNFDATANLALDTAHKVAGIGSWPPT